mgnify:CR=1 FL=1
MITSEDLKKIEKLESETTSTLWPCINCGNEYQEQWFLARSIKVAKKMMEYCPKCGLMEIDPLTKKVSFPYGEQILLNV